MKTTYKIVCLLLLTSFVFFASPHSARACVQTHDSVYTKVHYETPGNTDVSITLTNLRLATGTPNEFCSCGITAVTSIFSQILYVAFVDSGTINPIPGFDQWNPSAQASNAWNSVLTTNDWSAFVSSVGASGLQFNRPVELIIRARLAPGYTYTLLDSILYVAQLGTDAYDNANQVLGNMHQDISGIQGPHTLIPEGPGSTYFATLDAALMTSNRPALPAYQLEIYPVPARDELRISLSDPLNVVHSMEVFDMQGRRITETADLKSHAETMDISQLPTGVYLLKVSTSNGVVTKKFSKSL